MKSTAANRLVIDGKLCTRSYRLVVLPADLIKCEPNAKIGISVVRTNGQRLSIFIYLIHTCGSNPRLDL
jgi:hypothetical protein